MSTFLGGLDGQVATTHAPLPRAPRPYLFSIAIFYFYCYQPYYILSLHFSNLLQIPANFLGRPLNQGFSGGEKKKNELLQLALLNTKCGI